ncbi:MAG: DegV family protein [Anaerolineales bacterium]|jgi:DegV family protein with EDD domain
MSNTCILTDSTAQFPTPAFPGRSRVNIISMELNHPGRKEAESLRAHDFPASAPADFQTTLLPPSVEAFEKNILQLAQSYSGIVLILHAHSLSGTYHNGLMAAKNLEGQVEIEVIDSGTIATGLGLAVQTASEAAEQGLSVTEISELIRSLLPRIYSVFCIPGLTYLHHRGYLNLSQAIVGEHLKLLPVYVIEEGELVPTQKARNKRHLVDLMHEFITEFESLDHIGLIQGVPPFEAETRSLREHLAEDYGDLSISEHIISPELSIMVGPSSLGMFILQSP